MGDSVVTDGVWIESRGEDNTVEKEEVVEVAAVFLCVSVSFSQVD